MKKVNILKLRFLLVIRRRKWSEIVSNTILRITEQESKMDSL